MYMGVPGIHITSFFCSGAKTHLQGSDFLHIGQNKIPSSFYMTEM